jgi:hypothetical protein
MPTDVLQGAVGRTAPFLFLLPLWEKVPTGGLRPPFFRTPMLCIGYGAAKADEGALSAETDPSPVSNELPLIRSTQERASLVSLPQVKRGRNEYDA